MDCLLLASSAATLWVRGDWHIVLDYTPSGCLATGIVNLYTVMGLPAGPGRTAVPLDSSVLRSSGSSRWGHPFGSSLRSFVRTRLERRFSLNGLRFLGVPWFCAVQDLRDGVTLGGRVCVPAHALDRIVGLPEPLAPSSFTMRSPLWVEPAYLCTYSIVTKTLPWPVLGFKFFRDGGHPFRVECPYLCMYSIGSKVLNSFVLGFKFLRVRFTLSGRVSVFYTSAIGS